MHSGCRRESSMTDDLPSDTQALAEQVAATFVHRLFPSLRSPVFLACPDDECAAICRTAIAVAAKRKRVKTEVVALKPDPAAQLDQPTMCELALSGHPDPDSNGRLGWNNSTET